MKQVLKELIQLLKNYWVGIVLFFITMIIMDHFFGTVCFSVILLGIPCPACGIIIFYGAIFALIASSMSSYSSY